MTRIIQWIEDLLGVDMPDMEKLSRLKLMLTEKLDVLRMLDVEVLGFVEEEVVAEEIEQSGKFKESIYAILVRIECALAPPPWNLASMDSSP